MIIEGREERMLGRFISRYKLIARRNIFWPAVAHEWDYSINGAFQNNSMRREDNLLLVLGRLTGMPMVPGNGGHRGHLGKQDKMKGCFEESKKCNFSVRNLDFNVALQWKPSSLPSGIAHWKKTSVYRAVLGVL